MMDGKTETRLVKQALAKAGIKARVGHGTGTASSWLHVYIGKGERFGEHIPHPTDRQSYCAGADAGCNRCQWVRKTRVEASRIAREVSGRDKWHDDCINIMAQ